MKPIISLFLPLVRLLGFGAVLLIWAGCGRGDDDKVTVYRIPKEALPTSSPNPVAANAGPAAAVHWTAPASWEEQPASGFRKGSFLARGSDGKTADISVISFPEQAGGLLANVNRWREQLKLAPITNVADAGRPMPVAGRDLFFVDLVSEQALTPEGEKSRILGGIFPTEGETWFFKMSGPDALVEAQRETFRQFLTSVHPAEGVVPAAAAAGDSTNAPTPPPIAAGAGLPLQYTLPPGWREKPPSTMRLASFDAGPPNEKSADVSVVALPGSAGGSLSNVNRWRDQVKLGPIDERELQQQAEHLQAQGHNFLVVDLASTEPMGEPPAQQRIVAAILDENGRSWFIKMTGEDATVAAQKGAFTDFLRSLQIP